MALFSIVVDIAARTANIENSLNRVEGRLKSFGSAVNAIGGTISVGAFAAFADHIMDLASELEHASVRTGTTVTAFQELAFAAKQGGVDTGQLENALIRMNRSLSLANTGGKQQTDTLRALGVSMRDLEGLTPDKQFELLADQINKLPTAADKARAEIVLFGRAGGELGTLIEKGARGIEEMRKQAENLGGVMSPETVHRLDEAQKSLERMTTSFNALAAINLAPFAAMLGAAMDNILNAMSQDKTNAVVNRLKEINDELERIAKHPNWLQWLETNRTRGLQEERGRLMGGTTGIEGAPPGAQALRDRGYYQGIPMRNAGEYLFGAGGLPNWGLGGGFPEGGGGPGAPGFGGTDLDKILPGLHIDRERIDKMKQYYLSLSQGIERASSSESKLELELWKIDELQKAPKELGGMTAQEADEARQLLKQNFIDKVNRDLNEIHIRADRLFVPSEMRIAVDAFTNTMKAAMLYTTQESGSFGRNLLNNILKALEDRAIYNAIEAIGYALNKALVDAFNATSGGGSLIGSLLSGAVGLFGEVGGGGLAPIGAGAGNPELNMVYPTIGNNSASRPSINFAPTYHINAPNGDAQLRQALPGLLSQTAQRTKADLLDAFRRNNLRAPARA